MANKVVLSADLYDNVLTEKIGDYSAKPRITGTARNEDAAQSIVETRTEHRKETCHTSEMYMCPTAMPYMCRIGVKALCLTEARYTRRSGTTYILSN